MWGRALRRFAREKLQARSPAHAPFACTRAAVGSTKSSPRRWHQRCSFPSQCGTPARHVARLSCRSGYATGVSSWAARGCAVAPDKDQPGGLFPVDDTQAGEEAPTTFAVGNKKAGLQTRANNRSDRAII